MENKDMELNLVGVWSTQHRELLQCCRTNSQEDMDGTVIAKTFADDCWLPELTTFITPLMKSLSSN